MNEITIEKGWYFAAGKKFKWSGEGAGIGIAKKYLDGEGDLEITVKGKKRDEKFIVTKSKIYEFVKAHSSHEKIGGTLLGFVSASFLSKNNKLV